METIILYPHISINVSDIDRSILFYRTFFDVEPIKVRQGYAKFELQNPKLNFTLNQRETLTASENSTLNHFGFQVESKDDVLLTDLRLRKLGMRTVEEKSTVCCYALQDKIWVQDPDGINWEVFVVHSDAGEYHDSEHSENTPCCTTTPVQISSLAA